ncbi:MAG: M64 family metallopeptidase [Bacteroidales bacterium]
MKRLSLILSVFAAPLLLLLVLPLPARAQAPVFADYFSGDSMRLDLYQIGNAKEETITLDQIYREGAWPGSRRVLLDPFGYGRYAVKVYDAASNRLIYAQGFDCMFGEYKTTKPALDGVKRVFKRSVRVPWPSRPVVVAIELRDQKNAFHELYRQKVDPADYHIIRETVNAGDWVYEALKSGDPQHKVDLAFIAEGYTAEDRDKFKTDVDRMVAWLFSYEPYKQLKDGFNIYGVFRPSAERGPDEPRQNVFKKTTLNASFNAFDTDRYMLVEEGYRLREIAAQVPYDTIVVLVNSKRYGGGGIYNDYCITTVDNERSKAVFIHEFGHSFAGLADEYYTSDVAYNDFYPKGVEPLEPNITALLDPAHLKWADLVSPGVSIPTEYGKERREALQAERVKLRQARTKETSDAKAKNAAEADLKAIEAKYTDQDKAIAAKIREVDQKYASLVDKVGAFEGAGYAAKGLYRPAWYCLMISNPKDEFCPVCQRAIERMVRQYGGR